MSAGTCLVVKVGFYRGRPGRTMGSVSSEGERYQVKSYGFPRSSDATDWVHLDDFSLGCPRTVLHRRVQEGRERVGLLLFCSFLLYPVLPFSEQSLFFLPLVSM